MKYLILLLSFLLPFSASAAIAIDATTNPDIGGASSPQTWSHTCGANAGIFVLMEVDHSTTVSATVGGNAMTLVGTELFPSGSSEATDLFYANCPAGSNTISVSFTDGFVRVAAASYTGASSSGQPEAQGQANTGSSPVSKAITTITDNAWLIGSGIGVNLAGGTNTTKRVCVGGNTGYCIVDSNGPQTPTGSHSLAITSTGGANTIGINVASLAPGAAAAVVTSFLGLVHSFGIF